MKGPREEAPKQKEEQVQDLKGCALVGGKAAGCVYQE